jgi:diguanylate cyclase (GGDEF)-like protein/PAS domain S-box-containing protein
MFSVLACIQHQHDWRLIVVAAVICLIGSFTTMLLFQRVQECERAHRYRWMATAAVTCGTGIWATHFIAMLAYDSGFPISYAPYATALSIIVAIATAGVASIVAHGRGNAASFAIGGAVLGLGVAAMHFTGMAAIEAPARLSYDVPVTVSAVLAGTIFASLALLAFHAFRGIRRFTIATALFVLAICSLHFTSMSGVTLRPDPTIIVTGISIDRSLLAGIVIAVSTALILAAFGAAYLDRHLTDLRGLANASLEGLLIVRDDRILDINERLVELSGWTSSHLTGRSPTAILVLGPEGLNCCSDTDGPSEITLLHADGGEIPIEILCRTIEYRGRESHVLVVRDITERKKSERRIEHLAHHDALTDLPNRALFDDRMDLALRLAEQRDEQVAILCLDLDRFKAANDIFGHGEGDRILRKVADILRDVTGPTDTIARLGGDEFAIIQSGAPQPESASQLANRVLAGFAERMNMARDPKAVGVTIGIALFPADGSDSDELRTNADTALYRAKGAGRGTACFFDAAMDEAARIRRELGHDLRRAILRNELSVAYQPLIAARTGQVAGYEALLRWVHPERGVIGPAIFIPIAEESGTIVELGAWVLEQACSEAARWAEPLTIAVNVSPVQFQLPNFCEQVADVLNRTKLDGTRLELEITEAVLMRDRDAVLVLLHRLRALGVRIVMDDFGTGYSSLSNLQSFPFDKIKIDGSFTAAIEHDEAARSIVRAIIGLGHSLNLPVVTEGVETEAQRLIVTEQNCSQLQGFLLGKPGAEPSRTVQPAEIVRLDGVRLNRA